MAWVVDTCLVIDVLENDPAFGAASAALIDEHASAGLWLCPVSYVKLAPAFLGDERRQREFLERAGIDCAQPWTWNDTVRAHRAWHVHVTARRAQRVRRRPVADVQIGAFALRAGGLLTRNSEDFLGLFPKLRIAVPAAP